MPRSSADRNLEPRAPARRRDGEVRQASQLALAAFMGTAGVLHFVVPETYAKIVPGALGFPRALVAATGVAEIVAGGLVCFRRTRRVGAWLSVGVLVAVFPANVKMALDGGIEGYGFPLGSPVAAWLRLPLQVPLVVWAWRLTRDDDGVPVDQSARSAAGHGR